MHQAPSSSYNKTRQSKIRQVLLITFFLNLSVALAKLFYGLWTQSLSLTADGYHSLFDASSNILGFVAIWFAYKPADEGHPYGHRKIETMGALAIALLLFGTCFEILGDVRHRIDHPVEPHVDIWSFVIMISTLIVNFMVSNYEKAWGKKLNSDILLADGTHTQIDQYVSLSVIASLISVKLGYASLDIVIACGIILVIIYAAFSILMENFNILLDAQVADPQLIENMALSVAGVQRCHKVRSRGSRGGMFIDFHIHVDPLMTTEESHLLTHKVIHLIKSKMPDVIDVLIHTEPAYQTKELQDYPQTTPVQ